MSFSLVSFTLHPNFTSKKCSLPMWLFYSLAFREGVEVTIEPRRVFCYEAQLTSFSPPYFGLLVSTGPGFYIRSLIHDLGQGM